MNEFWTTVLSSAGAAALASSVMSGIITTVASVWIQHVYDKKLEEHKAEVQKKIDEHQIQFEYWHKEKAKAIKTLFKNFAELSLNLNLLLTCEKIDDGSEDAIKRKICAIRSLTAITQKSFENGIRLSLFLDKKNYNTIKELLMKVKDFSELYNPNINNFSDTFVEQGRAILADTKKLLGELRIQFRNALMVKEYSLENKKEKIQVEKGKKA